jgi:hypothetical protein
MHGYLVPFLTHGNDIKVIFAKFLALLGQKNIAK